MTKETLSLFEIDRIPAEVLEALADKGVALSDVLLACHCDMDHEHVFCDTYFFTTADTLYRLSGTMGLEGSEAYRRYDKNRLTRVWQEKEFDAFPLATIKSFKTEELLSGMRFYAKDENGEYLFLCAMTNFCKTSILVFSKYTERIKNGTYQGVDPEDDPASSRCPKCGGRYPDKNRKLCPRCMERGKLFTRIASFFFNYKTYLVIILISLLLMSATALLAPYLSSGFFYDEVLDESGSFYGMILPVIGILILTRVITQLATMVNNYITSIISAKIVYDLKKVIFTSIERLSLGFFSGRQTGGLMTQVNNDASTIYQFFCDGVPYFMVNVVQVAAMMVIMFLMNPLLAAASLATIPIFFLIMRWLFRNNTKLHARRYSSSRAMNSQLADVLSGMRVVKAFSKENEEIGRFNQRSRRLAYNDKKLSLFNNYAWPITGMVLYSGNIIAWSFGGYLVISGRMTYGELITFITYMNMIYSPMYFFNYMINHTADCSNAMQRLFEIMDAQPEVCEKEDALHLDEVRGDIEFRDVEFSYTKSRKIIDKISFSLEAGKILGIVGHTGAGKSTLANLIMRLYDVESGSILIDGHDVKDLSFRTLHQNIAIVSQETYLFIGTILENIRYARPDATYDEVIAAAKCAGAHDFIIKLPDAYATRIGFGYKDLSGGERQRVSIARAILKDPKILILDEATAAMDTGTERRIQEALSVLIKGKTTIMIAHRLSTLRDADQLVVIEHGKVAESGTHEELLAKENGVYKKLFDLQLEALRNAGISE